MTAVRVIGRGEGACECAAELTNPTTESYATTLRLRSMQPTLAIYFTSLESERAKGMNNSVLVDSGQTTHPIEMIRSRSWRCFNFV